MVELCEGTSLEPERLEGRVEHVMFGQATRFESLDVLVSFFARVLITRELRGQPGTTPERVRIPYDVLDAQIDTEITPFH